MNNEPILGRETTCKTCGAIICFAKSRHGKFYPCDVQFWVGGLEKPPKGYAWFSKRAFHNCEKWLAAEAKVFNELREKEATK